MVPRMPHLELNGIPSISGGSATFREPWLSLPIAALPPDLTFRPLE